jgi:hypothetical protein
MPRKTLIRGDGVAACWCARLLSASGLAVSVSRTARPKVPVVLVSNITQALLSDVFKDGELLRGLAPIRKRIVLWGTQGKPVVIPHLATVVPEGVLLERLWSTVPALRDRANETADWNVITAPPFPDTSVRHFGSRIARTTVVDLKSGAEGEACWIESLAGGWLFLLGLGNQRGSLIAVGETTESLLAQSRLVVEQVSGLGASACEFPAYPRILEEVCGKGWLACGTGAMAFDPLCGDGTGTALREAILASAAIQGISRGLNPSDVRAHYSLRLRAGFLRHLEQCVTFYREARSGPPTSGQFHILQFD